MGMPRLCPTAPRMPLLKRVRGAQGEVKERLCLRQMRNGKCSDGFLGGILDRPMAAQLSLSHISPISRLYLAIRSPDGRTVEPEPHLAYISPISRLYLAIRSPDGRTVGPELAPANGATGEKCRRSAREVDRTSLSHCAARNVGVRLVLCFG